MKFVIPLNLKLLFSQRMVKDDFKIAYDSGCFGNGDLIKTKKGMLYTRALNETLSAHPTIEDDLEKLAGLKNE